MEQLTLSPTNPSSGSAISGPRVHLDMAISAAVEILLSRSGSGERTMRPAARRIRHSRFSGNQVYCDDQVER